MKFRYFLITLVILSLTGCRPFYSHQTRAELERADTLSLSLLPFFNLQDYKTGFDELKALSSNLLNQRLGIYDRKRVETYAIQATLNGSEFVALNNKTMHSLSDNRRSNNRGIAKRAALVYAERLFCNGDEEGTAKAIRAIPPPLTDLKFIDSTIFCSARLLEARIAIKNQYHETGMQLIKQSIDVCPASTYRSLFPLYINLEMRSLLYLDRTDEALELFDRASTEGILDNEGKEHFSALFLHAYKNTEPDNKLINLCIEVEDSLPDDKPKMSSATRQLAYDLHTSGKSDEAKEYAIETALEFPDNASAIHLLAELCRLRKEYEESAAYYDRFIRLSNDRAYSHMQNERAADKARVEDNINARTAALKKKMMSWSIVLTAIITLIALVTNRTLLHKKRKQKYEADMRHEQLVKKVILATASTIPELVSGITSTANLSTKYSPEVYEKLDSILDGYKKSSRNNLIQLLSDETIISPRIKGYIQHLSPQEKVITVLFQEGISIQDISKILGISTNNIRMNRSRIRKKIQEEYPEAEGELKILSTGDQAVN